MEVLYHSGTYNGHPVILNAELKSIDILEQEFDALLARTERLKSGIRELYAKHGIHILTPWLGSMFNIVVTELDAIKTCRNLQKSDFEARQKMDYTLLLNAFTTSRVTAIT